MKVLIIDDMHESITELLRAIGLESDYRPDITKEELLEVIGNYEGILVRSKVFFGKDIIEKAARLQFIGRAGAGLDNLDVEELTRRNIKLVNAPEGNRDAVAEQAIGMLLCLMNNVLRADKEVRNNKWDREGNRGYELMGRTVGIIGYGYMGRATAKRLSSFGCKVLAYDKYKKNYGDEFAQVASMDELQKEADVLSLHIPLTPETKYMVDYNYLNAFQKPLWLINTARGEIAKMSELVKAIQSGKLRGAALDVLENEKIKQLTPEQQEAFDFLKSTDKVLLTPHIAGWTFESYRKINEALVEKIKQILI
ncbi:MAG TPA: 2-hydroxyacid dehydrogenase [Cytophagaceae bacterium]|nr:2-hydroxyacid dehydrogenase [Cytophagaceae bacterium]